MNLLDLDNIDNLYSFFSKKKVISLSAFTYRSVYSQPDVNSPQGYS